MRTIRVTGKGMLKVHPDVTRITITLEGLFPDYGEALRRSAEDTEELRDLLSGFDFERTDLKTLNFSVDSEYESYQERGVYKQRFVGYKYSHRLKVEFDSDNERLGKVLYALAHSPRKPEFRISYTVKDPEAAKNELLAKAVADAKEKSAVLAEAAGITLKEILTIDYSWGHVEFEVHPMNRALGAADMEAMPLMAMSKSASYDMDIEPDDIEASDTVTVVWEIA